MNTAGGTSARVHGRAGDSDRRMVLRNGREGGNIVGTAVTASHPRAKQGVAMLSQWAGTQEGLPMSHVLRASLALALALGALALAGYGAGTIAQ